MPVVQPGVGVTGGDHGRHDQIAEAEARAALVPSAGHAVGVVGGAAPAPHQEGVLAAAVRAGAGQVPDAGLAGQPSSLLQGMPRPGGRRAP